jgi:hypothetical protein
MEGIHSSRMDLVIDSLASASPADTRQKWSLCRVSWRTLGKGPVTVTTTFLCRGDTRQSLCRVTDKNYSAKKSLSMYSSPRLLCRESHSAKTSPLDKLGVSDSDSTMKEDRVNLVKVVVFLCTSSSNMFTNRCSSNSFLFHEGIKLTPVC